MQQRLQHRTAAAASRVPATLLAVFALAPHPAGRAGTATIAAEAPLVIMLADSGAPAFLAGVPLAVMLADVGSHSPCICS